MPDEKISLLERVASYYSQLSTVAADLNAVSDELGKSIAEIDAALKKLNLGITTWVTIRGDDRSPYDDSFWSRDIGYAKVSNKWGISLRTIDGQCSDPDRSEIEEWLFNDAPRSLRLEAIDKIPELLEKLSMESVKTTKNIRAKLDEAQAVAEAVKGAANRTTRIPARVPVSDPKPKIDLTQVSKPGDVLKAILANQQVKQDKAPEAPDVSDSVEPNLDSVRHAVGSALAEAGHVSAAQVLGAGSWTLDGGQIRIEVAGMGKKMLALTMNAAAEKIIRQELLRIGAPARLLVVPGEGIVANPSTISASSSLTGASTEVK
jgi:prefoldin subunit 5